jgi:hypothetical protein
MALRPTIPRAATGDFPDWRGCNDQRVPRLGRDAAASARNFVQKSSQRGWTRLPLGG